MANDDKCRLASDTNHDVTATAAQPRDNQTVTIKAEEFDTRTTHPPADCLIHLGRAKPNCLRWAEEGAGIAAGLDFWSNQWSN